MKTKWSILCCAVTERMPASSAHLTHLARQVEKFDDVELIILTDNCSIPLGKKRNLLMSMASGEYVNFVDDDDYVPDDYVASIRGVLGKTDYIGFRVAHFDKGVRTKPVYHSLEHTEWSEDSNGFYRNVSHLNPIKRELVADISFEGLFGEDYTWSREVMKSARIKTQHFIDREMYFYRADTDKSVAYKQKELKKND